MKRYRMKIIEVEVDKYVVSVSVVSSKVGKSSPYDFSRKNNISFQKGTKRKKRI